MNEYREGASQTPRSVRFGYFLQPADNTLVIILKRTTEFITNLSYPMLWEATIG